MSIDCMATPSCWLIAPIDRATPRCALIDFSFDATPSILELSLRARQRRLSQAEGGARGGRGEAHWSICSDSFFFRIAFSA